MWSNKQKISNSAFKLDPISNASYSKLPDTPMSREALQKLINLPIKHLPPKEHRIFDLPTAPTFYPTESEFKDPAKYISSIRNKGEIAGICKIVPPPTFRPKSKTDIKDFIINTRKQEIGTIGISGYYNRLYIYNLRTFHKQIGHRLDFPPLIHGFEIDLYEVKLVVERLGGFDEVAAKKKWDQVINALDCGLSSSGEAPYILFDMYQRYMLPYEKHIENAHQFKVSAKTRHACCICSLGDQSAPLMACKYCKVAAHAKCIQFSPKVMPAEDWLCLSCIGARELEFEDGPSFTLADYGGRAARFKEELLNNIIRNNPDVPHVSIASLPIEDEENMIEKVYWQLVNDIYTDVSVEYGADMTSLAAYGGFPARGFGPWNLNSIPTLPSSLFSHLKEGISGITVPWAYVGMCLSTFCWHTEDHYTYSINYHHWGATKTWYGIPASHSSTFETAFRREAPKLFHKHPDLLSHLSFTLCPDTLSGQAPVYVIDQRPGEFVLTFPRAYHAGFNHGLNFNEAANFAPADWLPYGLECLSRYRKYSKSPVFSHYELLSFATTTKDLTLASSLISPLEEAIASEVEQANKVAAFISKSEDGDRNALVQCGLCYTFCFFSHVVCECRGSPLFLCLAHAAGLKDCKAETHTLVKTIRRSKISRMVARLKDMISMWEPWMKRYEELQKNTPSLADLERLAADVTIITTESPLAVKYFLRRVQRCRDWESKASSLLNAARNLTFVPTSLPDDIKHLLRELQDLDFQSESARDFLIVAQKIEVLHQEAKTILAAPSVTLSQLFELQKKLQEEGIKLPEDRQLLYLSKKLSWCDQVRHLLSEEVYAPHLAQELLSGAPSLSCPQVSDLVQSLKEFSNRTPPVTLTVTSSIGAVPTPQGEYTRFVETFHAAIERSESATLLDRPSVDELDAMLLFFQGLNCTNPYLTQLDYARLRVCVWRNQTYAYLKSKDVPLETTLVDYFSSLLAETQAAESLVQGNRSCICFRGPSPDSVICKSCRISYHPECVGLTNLTDHYICYICNPHDHSPKGKCRLEYSDLAHLISEAQDLPFVPNEFRLINEASQIYQSISERVLYLIPGASFDLLKDQLRLLEGLGIHLGVSQLIRTRILEEALSTSIALPSATRGFTNSSTEIALDSQSPKRELPLKSDDSLQQDTKRIQFCSNSSFSVEALASDQPSLSSTHSISFGPIFPIKSEVTLSKVGPADSLSLNGTKSVFFSSAKLISPDTLSRSVVPESSFKATDVYHKTVPTIRFSEALSQQDTQNNEPSNRDYKAKSENVSPCSSALTEVSFPL